MPFGKPDWKTFTQGVEKEWVVTNGLGGFAAGSIIGANTRKYHGLLIAAIKPPVDRIFLLSKIEEEVTIDGQVYSLSSNETYGGEYPRGYVYLHSFALEPFPIFTYALGNVFIEKRIFMIYGENSTIIRYHVYANDDSTVKLKLTPLVNCRDYHHTLRKNDWPFSQVINNKGTTIEAFPGAPKLHLASDQAHYNKGDGTWFEGIYYRGEESRGLDPWEDHFMPGNFTITCKGNGTFGLIASTEPITSFNPLLAQVKEEKRLSKLVEQAGCMDDFTCRLVLAADSFIVHRQSTGKKSIIAGYPWFTDWGRDTMIALPGLTLVTGRNEEAKEILQTFAVYCKDGLIPNSFPDQGTEPWYNNVDASLWYFQAVYKYLEYTGNYDFIKVNIYPVLKQIVKYYWQGTHYNIKMDDDGLISAGSRGVQLTWMDAKVGDWVVTPREGKPVEINALWYNALQIMAMLAKQFEDEDLKQYKNLALKTKESFLEKFWHKSEQCLYDVISETGKDPAIRPNQIIAVSLPYIMLDLNQAGKVVDKVWQELYCSYGLRSISPQEAQYQGHYGGSQLKRDGAYHQGTGWVWLLGPFVTAYRKVHDYSSESREMAERFLAPLQTHLRDHGVGTVSEIFDGDWPNTPNGCFSQAWSVAEVLRAYVEEVLEKKPAHKGSQPLKAGDPVTVLI